MKHIFYLLTIFPIMWELISLHDTIKVRNLVERLKVKTADEFTIKESLFSTFALGYVMWTLFGLFTSQWVLFLTLILISSIPLKKYIWYNKIDAIISLVLLLFIILNAYHFNIDIFEWILSKFN